MERKPRLRGGKVMSSSSYILCDEAEFQTQVYQT